MYTRFRYPDIQMMKIEMSEERKIEYSEWMFNPTFVSSPKHQQRFSTWSAPERPGTLIIIIISDFPMRITFYLVRHGETTANRDGILQGHSDYELTDKGRIGASLTGRYLSKVHFDHVYVSDLGRAVKTADLILQENASPASMWEGPVHTSFLRERYFGVRENLRKEISAEEARRIVAEKRGVREEEVIEIEESLEDLLKRQQSFFAHVREEMFRRGEGKNPTLPHIDFIFLTILSSLVW